MKNRKRQKDNLAFSKRLFELWKLLRITQKEFAKAINISENAAGNYLRKGRVPEWDILVRISTYFDKSIDWLLTGEDNGLEAHRHSAEAPMLPKGIKYEGTENRSGKDRRNGLAYESCDRLLEIERLNRAVFLLTVGDIKSRLWALEHLESPGDTLCNNPKNVEHKPS